MQTLVTGHTLKRALAVQLHLAELSSFHLLNHLAMGFTRSLWYLSMNPICSQTPALYIGEKVHFTLNLKLDQHVNT